MLFIYVKRERVLNRFGGKGEGEGRGGRYIVLLGLEWEILKLEKWRK